MHQVNYPQTQAWGPTEADAGDDDMDIDVVDADMWGANTADTWNANAADNWGANATDTTDPADACHDTMDRGLTRLESFLG